MDRPGDHIQDSYDEIKLSCLKKQISLSKTELFDLVNDDNKFAHKLKYFNRQGCACIAQEDFYSAIVYLNQAQVTLQYAASCGKTIDRSLIITTLHNEACVYQRIWELQKASDYVEGIIYNITSFLAGENKIQLIEEHLDDKSEPYQKLTTFLQNKMKLVTYYLEFCALNSQLKLHEYSLNSAAKSLDILKEICELEHQIEIFMGMKYHTQYEKNVLFELKNIKDFKDEVDDLDNNLERFFVKAKKSIGIYQKKIKFNHHLLDSKEKEALHSFSIGSIMQLFPATYAQPQKRWIREELTPLKKIHKALYISIAHFTMATELRLLASDHHTDSSRKNSTEFKCSQLHHLIAIITVTLYVPYQTIYLEHILNSYKNHYQVDLSVVSQSTITQDISVPEDDEIHLEISSLYRKKQQKQIKLHKSTIKSVSSQSPSLHLTRNTTIKMKCKQLADSQKPIKLVNKSKSKHKSKKSKSKDTHKSSSRKKQDNLTPLIHKKSPIKLQSHKPPKPKNSSKSKHQSQYSTEKRKIEEKRSIANGQSEKNGLISRKNQREKKSLRSSQRRVEIGKIDQTELKFIRSKSPKGLSKQK